MIFSSVFFIFIFLPLTLVLYFLVPRAGKNVVLLISSLIFYAWGEPIYIVLMMFSIVYNYISGVEIDYYRNKGNRGKMRFVFWMAVAVNLAVLMFFKYYGFLMENLNAILPVDIPYKELSLPVGISFYTFQTLSYIIDVYKDNVGVQRNLISFGTYITMFPQLIAGPIVRYSDIEGQLEHRRVTVAKFGNGVAWFLRGLAKKVLLANNIGMAYDAIAALPQGEMSVLSAWVGCAAYTFQIYFDFSGYSDMAIGLGKMFGFEFMMNFNYPYISKSVTEFWRRWHISLGTWFREYVYIPLGGKPGGNQKGDPEYFHSLVSHRILARSCLEFYLLGTLLRDPSVAGEICTPGCAGAAAGDRKAYLHTVFRNDRLGIVLLAGNVGRAQVYRDHVWHWSPWICGFHRDLLPV